MICNVQDVKQIIVRCNHAQSTTQQFFIFFLNRVNRIIQGVTKLVPRKVNGVRMTLLNPKTFLAKTFTVIALLDNAISSLFFKKHLHKSNKITDRNINVYPTPKLKRQIVTNVTRNTIPIG
jgi:hypothetical protein